MSEQNTPTPPWSSDRDLDVHIVHKTLTHQFPDLCIKNISFLGSGWDNEVFCVETDTTTLAFRFPKRKAVIQAFLAEHEILRRLAPKLTIQVPHYIHLGQPDEHFPYPYGGYTLLEGICGDGLFVPEEKRAALARQLGSFLTTLHELETSSFRDVLPENDLNNAHDWLETLMTRADDLRGILPPESFALWRPYIEGTCARPGTYEGERVLLHNDFGTDHIMLHPQNYTMLGVLDFMDAAVGDPVSDFVGLYRVFGQAFVEQVLQNYGRKVDEGFWPRLVFSSRVGTLLWLWDAWAQGLQEDLARHIRILRQVLEVDLRDGREVTGQEV